MPAPKDRAKLTSWLKEHGYRWVLQSPAGTIVSIAEAIQHIEEKEREDDEDDTDLMKLEMMDLAYEPLSITGVYYSEEVSGTGHVQLGQHDDDTGEFTFLMDNPKAIEEQDGITRYTFTDGAVLIQHDGLLETEHEWKEGQKDKQAR